MTLSRSTVYAELLGGVETNASNASNAYNAVEFMATSWHSQDEDAGGDDEEDEEEDEDEDVSKSAVSRAKYVIRAFGVTREGRSVCLRVDGFTPYFYVKAPPQADGLTALNRVEQFLKDRFKTTCIGVSHMRKKDFWGFTNGELFDFFRLKFRSHAAMRKAASSLGFPVTIAGMSGSGQIFLKVYESNIDPLLRFLHIRDLRSVGWLRTSRFVALGKESSTCDVAASCHWQSVNPAPDLEQFQAPLLVAGFDIECDSAHGDFPVAKKDYRKLAIDLESAFDRGGIKTMDPHSAKQQLVACMESAFSISGGKVDLKPAWSMARLELKKPPAEGSDDMNNLVYEINNIVDDVYFALKNPPVKGSASGRSVVVPIPDAEDEQDEDIEVTVVGTLTSAFRKVFQKRWPLRGDAVIQIGLTLGIHAPPTSAPRAKELAKGACPVRCIFTLGSCDPIEADGDGNTAVVRSFEKEADLLLAFVDLIRDVDPDVLLGYNIFGFDMAYLYERAVELMGLAKANRNFCRFGRIERFPSVYVEQKLSSSALGDNVLKYLDMHGRIVVDLMKVVQRDHRLDSYKLDAVAEHFIGLRKNDVSPNDIFRMQKGSSYDRKVIAEYCLQDCALCNQIAAKLQILTNNSGMANVCRVPLSFIFMRGQGVKIFSLVAHRCREDGFLIPVRKKPGDAAGPEGEQDGYEGAIVLEPETGMYLETPVSVLDYNSLYPSSMISHNLSHDSLVIDPKYDHLPGVEYIEVPYDLYEGEGDDKRVVGKQVCRWARVQASEKEKDGAVLPRILKDLLAQRKATRKKIETEPDPFVKAVLDGLQLAYKVTANSLYGQMGAKTSPLYLKHIAACTTAVGRSMILTAKEYVESPEVGGHVVYGDSIAPWTPVLVRVNGDQVWHDTVERISERLQKHANLWRPCFSETGRETKEAFDFSNAAAPKLDVWSDVGWIPVARMIRHRLSPHKRILRIHTRSGVVDVTDDHSLIRANGEVVKPRDLVKGDSLLHWNDAPDDGRFVEDDRGLLRSIQDHVILKQANAFLQRGCLPTEVLMLDDETIEFEHASGDFIRNPHEVVSVRELSPEETYRGRTQAPYVYDFTTAQEPSRFAAGVGRIVVHNTDSIFVVFKNEDPATGEPLKGRDALASSIKQGQAASKGIKPILPVPHNLEYEKTMFPLILLSKKRYVGLLYEDDPDAKPKQKSMGIALKRRDYAPIVKQIYGGIIDIILNDRDIPKAVDFLRTKLTDLVEGKYEIADLIISKTLRSYYKTPYQIPHWVLAKRMHERDPGSAPQSNDRIPYVFVECSKKNALMGDRIEHASYVAKAIEEQNEGRRKPDVFVDTKLYIQNQIQKPCLQLLAIVLEKLPGYVSRAELTYNEGFDELLAEKGGNRRKARERLDTLREREVERLMFEPVLSLPEIRQRDNRCSGQLDLHVFFPGGASAATSASMQKEKDKGKTVLPNPKAPAPKKKTKAAKDVVVNSQRIDSFYPKN